MISLVDLGHFVESLPHSGPSMSEAFIKVHLYSSKYIVIYLNLWKLTVVLHIYIVELIWLILNLKAVLSLDLIQ